MTQADPSPAAQAPKAPLEFDIQHDDEFEDFPVKSDVASDKPTDEDLLGDWDDDVVDDFSKILAAQREQLG
jgi:hypothetical protein